MRDQATVGVTNVGESVIVRITGEIDIANIDVVSRALEAVNHSGRGSWVVDLTETTYLDSVGIRLLCTLAERLRFRRQELRLVAPAGAPVRRVLALTDVDQLVTMHQTVQEALTVISDE